jgi:DNA-binding transcriptional MerR regulator
MTTTLFNIGQLAKESGTAPDTLRYYERLGLLSPAARSDSGYRHYDETAIERLAFIRRAQALGLSLAEVRDVVRIADQGTAPCAHVQAMLERHLNEVDARMAELRALRQTIEQLLANAPAARARKACLCGIIESLERPADKTGQRSPVRRSSGGRTTRNTTTSTRSAR